jgi:diguanylate cyclase
MSEDRSKLVNDSASPPARRRPISILIWACVFGSLALATIMGINGYGRSIDEQARLLRDSIRDRPATGQIHVVEIDASSIARLKSWPWPRSIHGALVDKLHQAGAATVAFDVDFSATTRPEEDSAFAAALARFGGSVILATFRQSSGSGSSEIIENLPMAALAKHSFLGSVNVEPDKDGQMRFYSFGTVTNAIPRPSIGALLIGKEGRIDQSFRIDQAIDPSTIPRHSYADILSGKVGKAALQGKTIIVGATAIELGDRYAVPHHGVIPGVVIQALAAETLMQGTENTDFGFLPLILISLGGSIALASTRSPFRRGAYAVATMVVIASAPLVLEMAKLGSLQLAPGLVLVILVWGARAAIDFASRLNSARFVDGDSGLANERAMRKTIAQSKARSIVALRIGNFGEMSAILTLDQRQMLLNRVVDRITMAFGEKRIFQLQPGLLALSLPTLDADELSERMEAAAAIFRSPINLETRQIVVTLVCGVATSVDGNMNQCLANARLAADAAAANGHRWGIHNDARLGEADRALQLLADLDEALANKDIHAVFQPKWNIAANRICGAEALVRWRHPVLGAVTPDEFIPLLEQRGRTSELTLHVLDISLAQLARWEERELDVGVAVNLSAPLLMDTVFMERLREAIRGSGPLAAKLTLEITESATLSGLDSALEAVRSLKDLGIALSIDDYGTGQSTLTYLKTFSASEIKIDKSFITNMLSSRNDQILVRSTIELAHELGFKVVAEGIEDAQCLDLLKSFGCDVGQGWHLGRPIAAEDFIDIVLRSRQVPDLSLQAAA